MVDEYIRRQDVLKGKKTGTFANGICVVAEPCVTVEYIESLEPADVVPVRHGTWLPIVSYNNTYKCSECGRLLVDITDGLKMVAKNYPYCHCGAKMDAQGEET